MSKRTMKRTQKRTSPTSPPPHELKRLKASEKHSKPLTTTITTTAPASVHDSLNPRLASRSTTPASALAYYDDAQDPTHEYVRLPKRRNYDLFKVPRADPIERNAANVALTSLRYNGERVALYAKMDTGSDINLINRSTLEQLYGPTTRTRLRRMPREDFALLGENFFSATHSVDLTFTAGRANKEFNDMNFVVVQDDPELSAQDGLPNVVLGWPTLKEHSMVMIDFDLHAPVDAKLPLLAAEAEEENAGTEQRSILTTKYPPRPAPMPPKGVKR
ncbi:hypothetical protein B0A50_00258 [Salinomyces thailandicus]|uniref:Uncharacterized protein n=1 Tax=Salinomyces thailandicus TaxID=706561 RepID=A0A4U0UFF1_9PEZI|nr:hypothetical protein B0A50_00258 [Salinomyces thailandica]